MRISDWSSDVCSSDLAVKLAAHHVQRLSGVAFRFRLADADDGCQAVADRGFGLGAHLFAGFMLVGAALAVADDDEPRARFLQPRRGDAAGMRALVRRVAILCADRKSVV